MLALQILEEHYIKECVFAAATLVEKPALYKKCKGVIQVFHFLKIKKILVQQPAKKDLIQWSAGKHELPTIHC